MKNVGLTSDTLLFKVPNSDRIVKKFRLDFENVSKIGPIKIIQLQLLFEDKTIVLDQGEVFKSLFNISPSVKLDKKNQIIDFKKDVSPFDPYVIFSPLAELSLQKPIYTATLILPFFIFLLIFIVCQRKQYKLKILDFLMLLFIGCIPLKIAWTTFCILLLCVYGLISLLYKKKMVLKNPVFYVFIGVFSLLVLFGRPSSFSQINLQLSFLLFAVISVTVSPSKLKIYKYYSFFLLLLNAIMLASGISFLLWFNDFYALGITDYFNDIKIYSGDIRKWLYYDHAAFLSFFGLTGILFMHKLYSNNEVDVKWLYLYHLLLFLFIVLMATRICLILYIVLLVNMLLKCGNKKRILANTFIYILFAVSLIYNIKKIDINRCHLWSVSWEAIKEKPLFGYGLGQSNTILHDQYFVDGSMLPLSFDLNHSHNQFLTFFLEIGVIGFSVLFGALVWFLYKTKLYRNTTLVLFIFGLGYMFLTESILQTSKPLYVICFLFMIIATKHRKS